MTVAGASLPHPLAGLGFDEARVAEVDAAGRDPHTASRVVRMDRGWATLQGVRATRRVRLRECPQIVVGDWLTEDPDGTLVRLARTSLLVRRAVSGRDEPQEMAANVDVVLVTWALDTRVGSSRLHDMLVLARESGAIPVLALSKVDVTGPGDDHPGEADGVVGLLAELGDVVDGVEVVVTSAVTGEGIDRLQAIASGHTVVLLGSSGAGKSTLTNVLLGVDERETADVGRTGEGRHTTTSRELLPLPGGGAIVDTPGIRAATMWEDDDADEAESRFPDLDGLAEECRFNDCAHRGTPGCALERAVAGGELARSRRDAYLDYVDERSARDDTRAAVGRQRVRDLDRDRRPRP
jgi:ribosome biogenesis GTPase